MAVKIIVASGKGGAGKTSFSAGLALSLKSKGRSVLIVDCDAGQGCIDFMLQETEKGLYNWGDVIKERCACDEAVCKTERADFIPAPKKWDDEFTEEKFAEIIAKADGNYDYIIFDSPAGIGGGFRLAASCADRGIIISTPDEICVKAAASAADELFAKGISDVKLVINRFNRAPTAAGKMLNVDEVIDAVRVQLIGVVPEDKLITYTSSAGIASLKDCPAKAAYGRIASRILGEKVNLVLTPTKKEKPKSKKPLIIILSVLLALIVCAAGIFVTDYFRIRDLKNPIFARQISDSGDGTSVYSGGFYQCKIVKSDDGIESTIKIFGIKKTSQGVFCGDE